MWVCSCARARLFFTGSQNDRHKSFPIQISVYWILNKGIGDIESFHQQKKLSCISSAHANILDDAYDEIMCIVATGTAVVLDTRMGLEDNEQKQKRSREEDAEEPRDAKVVRSLLSSMGVERYEPRVVHQFLELWYRYIVDVLSDAQTYSEHAGKNSIDCDDIKLAIQSKVNFSFSQPPPREVLLELARNRNKIPLPKSIPGTGVPLPPEQDTLISPNYQLALPKRQPSEMLEETEEEEEEEDPNMTHFGNPNMSHDSRSEQQNSQQKVSFPLVGKRSK